MDNAMPLDVPVERIIIHEQYNGNKIANDIALVKLKNSVTFNGEFLNILLINWLLVCNALYHLYDHCTIVLKHV